MPSMVAAVTLTPSSARNLETIATALSRQRGDISREWAGVTCGALGSKPRGEDGPLVEALAAGGS